ncbi:hypothetical protein ACFQU7_08935 [Pseudoroseomonas wenyumeiae]
MDLLRQTGAAHLEFRQLHAPYRDWDVRPPLHYTFRKPITGDAEKDMKAIPRKQRAMVRKGIQNGLQSVSNSDTGMLHRVYAESVHNLGTPVFPRKYFDRLAAAFPQEHDVVTVMQGIRPSPPC